MVQVLRQGSLEARSSKDEQFRRSGDQFGDEWLRCCRRGQQRWLNPPARIDRLDLRVDPTDDEPRERPEVNVEGREPHRRGDGRGIADQNRDQGAPSLDAHVRSIQRNAGDEPEESTELTKCPTERHA
jgi:hypothetical protein